MPHPYRGPIAGSWMLRAPALAGAALTLLLGGCGTGTSIPANAVAVVGHTPITKAEFQHWMTVANAGDPNHLHTTAERRRATMELLIPAHWTMQQANALGVTVTPKQIQSTFQEDKKGAYPVEAIFQQFLKKSGQTLSDILFRVKIEALTAAIHEKITRQNSVVPAAQLDKYYREADTNWIASRAVAGHRSVEVVETKTPAQANQAKREIQSGATIETVAKKRSIQSIKQFHSQISPGIEEEARDQLSAAVLAAAPGVLTGPVKIDLGFNGKSEEYAYAVFDVKSVTPRKLPSIAQAHKYLREELSAIRGKEAVKRFNAQYTKRWTAATHCAPDYIAQGCQGYKPPKTPPTTTSPSGRPTKPSE